MKSRRIKSTKALPGVKKPSVGIIPIISIANIKRLFPFMVIILAYLFIFVLLRGKILFTPDLDRSDAFHLNVSLKYYLWQTLHNNSLPFWTQKLQGGFPLLAEGQIGALYLPNLILYRLFSFETAYLLSFVGSLFLFTLGFYLLLRNYRVGTIVALLFSFSAAFSGFISFRWVHLNLIQTVSLYPIIFLSAQYAYFSDDIKTKLLHSFFIAQLIFAGHVQVAFLCLAGVFAWYVLEMFSKKTSVSDLVRTVMRDVFPSLVLGIIMALPQVLPTLMLMKFSGRAQQSGYSFATLYSFSIQHIVSFVTPFFFGNPKYHTYPLLLSRWGVFWENTPYIGELLAVIFASTFLYIILGKKKQPRNGLIFLGLFLIFLVLSLGSNSPLYFIFDLPPFSLFRTPAKYLIPATFFLLLGGALYIDEFSMRTKSLFLKIFLCISLFCNVILLVYTAFSYHVFINAKEVLTQKSITSQLKKNDRYVTYGFSPKWSSYFSKHGWAQPADINTYKTFNSLLIPDSNFMYGGESSDINTGGLRLRRIDLINGFLEEVFGSTGSAQVDIKSATNLLNIAQINTIVSTDPITRLNTLNWTVLKDKNGFYHYRTVRSPGYYTPRRIHEIRYADDFQMLYEDGKVSTEEAVVEESRSAEYSQPSRVFIQTDTDRHFQATVTTGSEAFFVIGKNWYPEWNISLDGKQINPVRTNLIHMGVPVPPGKHTVRADYVPYSFYAGILVAGVGFLAIVLIMVWNIKGRRQPS